jgi:hypothetical protein
MDELLGRFVEFGLPVTGPFIVDVVAYSHLAAAYSEEAYVLLRRCIEMDPDYSSAYLHLGDYFLVRRVLTGLATQASASDLWHAEACFQLVIGLEKNRHSRIRRLAQGRLQLIRAFAADGPATEAVVAS